MRLTDSILPELDHESKTTRTVLSRVPMERNDYKPHTKSMSLGQLATHVATLSGFVKHAIAEDSFDFGARGDQPATPQTQAELLALFDAGLSEMRADLAAMSNERAMGTVTFRNGDAVIMQMPRIAVVRTILMNHGYHHRGQLSVYLRLLDVPVPSIYGPSADENPFA
jgi:uncharacterized damage-inducible protein DinB